MYWLNLISYISIGISIFQTIIILVDVIRHPQRMRIMNVVWTITGLYFPIVGIWLYYSLGRKNAKMHENHEQHKHHEHHGHSHSEHQKKPFWQSVIISTTHCSSGCSIGDLIGVPIVFLTGLTIWGSKLFSEFVIEFILAYVIGIAFQYFGMGMTKKDPSEKLKNALKADTLSLLAFEVGMFGMMALFHYVIFTEAPAPTTPVFWFLMQLAMMIGFGTSYPANWFLVKNGIKHAM